MGSGPADLVVLGLVTFAYGLGGWLVARHAFRLEPRERLIAGWAIGLALYVAAVNGLGRVLPADAAFKLGSVAVLALGGVSAARSGKRFLDVEDLRAWPQLVAVAALTLLVALMGRGLSILDDRKNLSIISLMAAGDIPPHFYMDPEVLYRYHYGFQLFAASLVRLGGLFPWSAFDLAKGLAGALSIVLGYLVGQRLTHRAAGGWVAAALLALGSGARWLLLLVPPAGLRLVSGLITMWGTAGVTAGSLDHALISPWVIAGGPPTPIPFAYVNGILEPFSIGVQAGPGSLSRILLALVILLGGRLRGGRSLLPLGLLLGVWALASEATYGIIFLGFLLVAVLAVWIRREMLRGETLRVWVVAWGLSLILALVQGGTLTEVARGVMSGWGGGAGGSGAGLFALRWPPAIVSAHLGELRLDDFRLVLVALVEMGAAVLLGPWVSVRCLRWLRQGRLELAALGASGAVGFLLPLFVRYQADRDVSRFTAHALLIWMLLGLGAWAAAWRRRPRARPLLSAYTFVLCFGGLATLASLLTAVPRGVISEEIAPLDAQLAKQVWDRLEPGSVVLDSHAWRSVVLTGRWARSTGIDGEALPEWEALVAEPDPAAIAAAGYRYVYLDTVWWRTISPKAQAALGDGCVRLVAAGEDDADNGSRRLLDVGACAIP